MPRSHALCIRKTDLQTSKTNDGQRPGMGYQCQALPMPIQRLLLEESFLLHGRAIKASPISELTRPVSGLGLQDHSAYPIK
jgi:hypothetical protein